MSAEPLAGDAYDDRFLRRQTSRAFSLANMWQVDEASLGNPQELACGGVSKWRSPENARFFFGLPFKPIRKGVITNYPQERQAQCTHEGATCGTRRGGPRPFAQGFSGGFNWWYPYPRGLQDSIDPHIACHVALNLCWPRDPAWFCESAPPPPT